MKYLENATDLGIAPVPDEFCELIMENVGVEMEENAPDVVAVDDSLYGLSPEVTTIDDTLCIKLEELEDNVFESIKEDPSLTESVELDDETFLLDEVVELDGEFFVTLVSEAAVMEAMEELEDEDSDEDSDEEFVMEIAGKEYAVIDDEDEADTFAYLCEDEEGDYYVVDDEEDAEFTVYLSEVE